MQGSGWGVLGDGAGTKGRHGGGSWRPHGRKYAYLRGGSSATARRAYIFSTGPHIIVIDAPIPNRDAPICESQCSYSKSGYTPRF